MVTRSKTKIRSKSKSKMKGKSKPDRTYLQTRKVIDGRVFIIGEVVKTKAEAKEGANWWKTKLGATHVRIIKSKKPKSVKGSKKVGRYAVYVHKKRW